MNTNRRQFLQTSAAAATSLAFSVPAGQAAEGARKYWTADLAQQVGITTSSIDAHVSADGANGTLPLVDLPKFMRNELDMHVIDLNTRTLGSLAAADVERFRNAVERAGCLVTNLKLNQRELDLGNRDADVRRRTMIEYRRCVDAAARLGARWVRPYPSIEPPVMKHLVAGYRELADYAEPKNIGVLVENYRWMESDPRSATRLIQQIDRGVAASPDIGNWASNKIRYAGLKSMFPLAVTCDFKARELGPNGEHELYDLQRCFQIGWDGSFRGPWCIEHANRDRSQLVRELNLVRDMLRGWMKEKA